MIVIFKNYQNTLDSVYQWQQNNNMMCSSLYGTTGSHQRKIYYLHLGMKNLIEPSVKAKDLGIFIDEDTKFSSQRIKETKELIKNVDGFSEHSGLEILNI